MKKFFYLALAVMTAMTFTACGSDDDDNGKGGNSKQPVTITPASMADQAATFQFSTPLEFEGGKITELSILDGGMVSVTLEEKGTGKKKVYTADVTKEGTGKYKVNGKFVKGTFDFAPVAESRGGEAFQMNLNITINGQTYSSEGTPVECIVKTAIASMGGTLNYICQKFLVKSMIIECDGDVNVFKTIPNGNLLEVYNEANANGANLSAEDKKGFDKVVKYVAVSRGGEINIIYADETCDGGNWDWLNNQATSFNLWLKDKGMGNKFIPEKTTVDLEFSGNTCAMTIHAKITGSKTYNAALTFVMDVVK